MKAERTLVRIFKCFVAWCVVFCGWWVADPALATLHDADPTNAHALAHLPLYRLVVYTTYLAAIAIVWILTGERDD